MGCHGPSVQEHWLGVQYGACHTMVVSSSLDSLAPIPTLTLTPTGQAGVGAAGRSLGFRMADAGY